MEAARWLGIHVSIGKLPLTVRCFLSKLQHQTVAETFLPARSLSSETELSIKDPIVTTSQTTRG